jgi:RNA polymerase subunit RPABC4/transcription elongation factor Spt4
MTEQNETIPVRDPEGSSPEHLHCYRCGSLLDKDPSWCGRCGAGQFSTCNRCGTIYRKADGRCPSCGTRRVRRRERRRRLKVVFQETVLVWIEAHKRIIFFTVAGFAIGITLGAVLKALSQPSLPEETPHFTSLRYWIDPFIAAGRTIVRAIGHAVSDSWNWIFNMIISHFKTSVLGLVGAIAGLVYAISREKKRRKSRSRHY